MKGVVFNTLEHVVVRDFGEDAWDDLLDAAGADGAYTSLGSYDDTDLYALAGAAAERFGMTGDEVVRWFGVNALPVFATTYPHFFSTQTSARNFVLSLNEIIHPEVRKLYPGADVPEFDFDTSAGADGPLRMTYRSARRLCSFAEGLLEGAGTHFGEEATVTQPSCMKRGDDACVLEVSFRPLEADGR